MKILVLDIETTPHLVWAWGLWKQNIAPSQIEAPSRILCWAAKWYGERRVYFERCESPELVGDCLEPLHDLLSEADAVVHYNGTKFDMRRINTEFAKLGWEQPDPYKQVDMLKTVRKHFGFPSNRLDYVCQELGLGRKVQTNNKMALWLDCMDNKESAWRKMEKYNRQDIKILENLYEELKGWIHDHPNFGLYVDDISGKPVCTNCGSTSVIRKGVEATRARVYRRYRCTTCLHPMRGASSLVRDPDTGDWTERKTDSGETR